MKPKSTFFMTRQFGRLIALSFLAAFALASCSGGKPTPSVKTLYEIEISNPLNAVSVEALTATNDELQLLENNHEAHYTIAWNNREWQIARPSRNDEVPGYSTFQSHNSRLVENEQGVFMTFLNGQVLNPPANGLDSEFYTTWVLLKTVDDGLTFSPVYLSFNSLRAPTLASDNDQNLHAAFSDWIDGSYHKHLIFLSSSGYTERRSCFIEGGGAVKYAMTYDPWRDRLYYATTHVGADESDFWSKSSFKIFTTEGHLLYWDFATTGGPRASMEYPWLLMASDTLVHAWTTQKTEDYAQIVYWNIRFMISRDGGYSWQTSTGHTLDIPVISDDGGNASPVSPLSENEWQTWLSGAVYQSGYLHFMYRADGGPQRSAMHHIRYNLESGEKDLDLTPVWRGKHFILDSSDGGFIADENHLYAVGNGLRDGQPALIILVSSDKGITWEDFAASPPFAPGAQAYAIAVLPHVSRGGYLLGLYTEQGNGPSRIRFFRVRAR